VKSPADVFVTHIEIVPKLIPFLLGSILALLMTKRKILNIRIALPIQITLLAAMAILTILFKWLARGSISTSFAPWISIALSASVTGLIYVALQPTFIGRLLAIKPLVFLGEISFSIYLLHMFISAFLMSFPHLQNIVVIGLSWGATIPGAYVLYLMIESPGILLGKRIGRKLQTVYFQNVPGPIRS
jgi:peptidoglycan/LPS O-acetylase OafA/YrhL